MFPHVRGWNYSRDLAPSGIHVPRTCGDEPTRVHLVATSSMFPARAGMNRSISCARAGMNRLV